VAILTTPQEQGLTSTSDYAAPDLINAPRKDLLSGLPSPDSIQIPESQQIDIEAPTEMPSIDELLANRAALGKKDES